MKFSRKPEVIEALQWTGDNLVEMKSFIAVDFKCIENPYGDGQILLLPTNTGIYGIYMGDWVKKRADGSLHRCSATELRQDYEQI